MTPVEGMIIASLISGGAGIFSSLLQKQPKLKNKQVSNLSPEQQRLWQMITQNMSPELMNELYGPINEGQLRERFERTTGEPARRGFNEELIPELQELFAGVGSKGGDAEQYQMASAAEKLQRDLAAQYEQTYQNELNARRGGVQNLLQQQPVTNLPYYTQQPNPLANFAQSSASATGDIFAKWLSNQPWSKKAAVTNTGSQYPNPTTAGNWQLPIYDPLSYGNYR